MEHDYHTTLEHVPMERRFIIVPQVVISYKILRTGRRFVVIVGKDRENPGEYAQWRPHR
ncbi:MAG: hypothetical protein ACLQNE_44795 [Thermoguttaceae bacterium]